jgi:hypothetical protein
MIIEKLISQALVLGLLPIASSLRSAQRVNVVHLKPLILLMFLTFMPILGYSATLCDQSHLSRRIQYFISAIQKERQTQHRIWFNHRLNEYPIFIVDSADGSQCAGLWHPDGTLFAIMTAKKAVAEYDAYAAISANSDYSDPQSPVAPLLPDLQKVLRAQKLNFAFVWIFGANKDYQNDKHYKEYPSAEADAVGVAIHEEFHSFVQEPVGDIRKTWTNFASQAHAEDEDLYRCYMGNEAVKAVHRQEVATLVRAYESANDGEAIQLAKEFLTLRDKRYELMPTIEYTPDFGQTRTKGNCKELEAIQELHEGIPKFIENSLIVDLGLATHQQVGNMVLRITNEYLDAPVKEGVRPIQSYYHVAAMELSLIRRFYRGDFLALTERISQPSAKVVISDLFSQTIGGLK